MNISESYCVTSLWRRGIEGHVARQILLGPNETAREILVENGLTKFTGGFVECKDIWEFYAVTEKYLTGILKTYKIHTRGMPEDVVRNSATGVYYYSPRVVLALSCLMVQGRNIPLDSKVMRVYKNLEEYPYYTDAAAEIRAITRQQQITTETQTRATKFVIAAMQDKQDSIELTKDGRVLISLDALSKLMQVSAEPVPYKKEPTRSHGLKKPVIATRGNDRIKFESIQECADFLGTGRDGVADAARGYRKDVRGYQIRFCN